MKHLGDNSQCKFLSAVQVAKRYGTSRATVWRWAKNGYLPKPVKLTPGTTRWALSDLIVWERAMEAM